MYLQIIAMYIYKAIGIIINIKIGSEIYVAFFALRAKILLRKTTPNSPNKEAFAYAKAMVIDMKIFLADFGSTFVKYAVYDTESGGYICRGKTPFPNPCTEGGGRFLVGEREVRSLVLSVFDTARSYDCALAFISVQMHGYLLMDSDGNMSDYVSWRDTTGDVSTVSADFQLRGTSKKPNLPFVKLYNRSFDGEVFFTLGSYIAWVLTGKNVTHKTDGCAAGFHDAASLTPYCPPGLTLPTLTHTVVPLGKWSGVTVYTPVGDHQASYLGSGAAEDAYLINIGTASQIACLEAGASDFAGCESRPYFKNERLVTVAGLMGGAELHDGGDPHMLSDELLRAIRILPPRSSAVIGGGGGSAVYEYLEAFLVGQGITCRQALPDVGIEGLHLLAESQRVKVGTMLSETAFTNFPIILKNTGVDFYIIDCEHGAFEYSTLSELITKSKLVGLEAIVRIGDNRREFITKLADMGASGFLLSMTNTQEDISEVVKYAKYSPIGRRGISTTRAHTLYSPPKLSEYMVSANRNMKIYAQIETAAGVDNITSILSVNGVDGVFIGPNDLSDDLGCIGNTASIKEFIKKVAAAADSIGKPWGIITANRELLDTSTACGVKMISCGSELNMLIDGCRRLSEKFV